MEIEAIEGGDPLSGVAGYAVDGRGGARTLRNENGKCLFDELFVAKDVRDNAACDVEVACPAAAGAFDRVSDTVLHGEVCGVCAGLPNTVE